MKAVLLAALVLAQVTPDQLKQPFEVPIQQQGQKPLEAPQIPKTQPVPENLQNWPKSCQRLHLETNKCENGMKSCNQRRINYWRKRCERDEPHGQ